VRGGGARLALAAALLFLYLPIGILVVYSFNDSRFALAWEGFTLDWYLRVLTNPEIGRALRNTLIVSVASTAVATVAGTGLALGLHFGRPRGGTLLWRTFSLPILAPDILQGVALLSLFARVALPLGLTSIILAHISFQVSFVAILVRSRLAALPPGVVDASRDLGAGTGATLRRVVLPLAAPGIAAGALVAFTLSVDDFLITWFTAGAGASTLPVRIYSMIKRGVTPEVNALATLLLVFSALLILLALRLLRRDGGEPHGTIGD